MAITDGIKGIVDFLTQGIESREGDDIFADMVEDGDEYMTEDNLALAPVPAQNTRNERRNESKVVSHPSFNRSSYEVVIVEPHSFSEAGSIVQNLIDRKTEVLNLHLLDKDQSQRTIDFVCGASHALNGNKPQQVGEMVFVFAPSNVTMSVDAQNSGSKFADIWGKSL